jgi:hypothetical protein
MIQFQLQASQSAYIQSKQLIALSFNMPTKTRPVEKIAKAAAQCSVEVRSDEICDVIQANSCSPGCGIWQMRGFGL